MSDEVFVMPDIKVCEPVQYFLGVGALGEKPNAAIVTDVGGNQVSLFMIPPGANQGFARSGVRHIDDPILKTNEEIRKLGCWDYAVPGGARQASKAYDRKRKEAAEDKKVREERQLFLEQQRREAAEKFKRDLETTSKSS